MKLVYYAFYIRTLPNLQEYQDPKMGGNTLVVNHSTKKIAFFENTLNPELVYKRDFRGVAYGVQMRDNTEVANLRNVLLQSGYTETTHFVDPRPQ